MSTTPDDLSTTLAQEQRTAADATAQLQSDVADFNPPVNNTPAFNETAPQDHFNEIVGISPLLVALGAIGGKFGNVHGIAMLESTNAMMKGIVTGSAEQYADARKQYENKYEQWQDQQRTWNDTYKAYMTAYKGRIDAQQRAVQGANAAVGLTGKLIAQSQKQVADTQRIGAQIEDYHSKIQARDAKSVTDALKAQTAEERAKTAQQAADLKVEQIRTQAKTADTNALAATSRSLKSEADELLRQYPLSAGKRPAEVDAKLKGLRDSMDLVNEKMKEHTQADYTKNKATYEEARRAIAAGVPKDVIAKRLADQGLDPGQL